MRGMFQLCNELEYIDLSDWNTGNVTNMDCMFSQCNKLKEIKGINKLKVNKVTSMKGMFQLCNELEYLDLSNWNTENVTNMEYMFSQCNKIKYLNLMNFSIRCSNGNMFAFNRRNDLVFITNNPELKKLYDSSS